MGDPGGALRVMWGVLRVAHMGANSGWVARTWVGPREVQGEKPCLPHTAWPLGGQPKRALLPLTLFSALPGRARRHENWYGYLTSLMHSLAVLEYVSLGADWL